MNPLDILYCWQAVLVACSATGLTQLVKVTLDVLLGHTDVIPTPTLKDMTAVGKDVRKRNMILNKIVFPGLPIVFGVLCAIIVPARPDSITAFVTEKGIVGWGATLIYASWGGACGQFADYIFSKVKGVMEALAPKTTTKTETAVVAVAEVVATVEPQDVVPPEEGAGSGN
jgi:hypothetical protein